MKLFLKILLFIVTMIAIIVGNVKSSTMVTNLQEKTSFFQNPVPIVLSGGEYAAGKIAKWVKGLKNLKWTKAENVVNRIRQAEEAGHTVLYEGERIVIKNGEDTVETITKTGDAVEIVEVVVKGGSSFVNQIDNTITKLAGKAKYELAGTGKYGDVLGHHPLAKSAFEGNFPTEALFKQYYDEAFSVSTKTLEEAWKTTNSGVPQNLHGKITGQQNSLYTAWKKANPNVKLTIDDMVNIEIKAITNAGISEDIATGWIVKALEKLKTQEVGNITNIPWNGLN